MSPDELRVLADRAVACKGWRWMPGMLAWRPGCPSVRVVAIEDAGNALQENGWLPDLSDPATLGCLLALVREAMGYPNGHFPFLGHSGSSSRGWFYCWAASDGSNGGGLHKYYATEAEALVVALEAAP